MSVRASIPFGCLPPGALPGWATAGSGGYLAYVAEGDGTGDVDFADPAGFAQAGATIAYVRGFSFTPDVRYVVALRAISDAGVEEENITCWCTLVIDGAGDMTGSLPNALQSASAALAAAGYVDVLVAYSRLGEQAAAVRIDVAKQIGGVPDWGNILGTVSLTSAQWTRETITVGPLTEGVAVTLVVRAVTAEDVPGPEFTCEAVTPDATGPAPAASLTAEVLA